MNIRLAETKDITRVVNLCKEHALYEKTIYSPTNKKELLFDFLFTKPSPVICLVIEKENTIIGYTSFMKQFSTWDAEYYLYIDCIFLKEEARGQGIGTHIMERIKKYAKKENCKTIQWQTPNFNKEAINFYKKIGGTSKTKERFFLTI